MDTNISELDKYLPKLSSCLYLGISFSLLNIIQSNLLIYLRSIDLFTMISYVLPGGRRWCFYVI